MMPVQQAARLSIQAENVGPDVEDNASYPSKDSGSCQDDRPSEDLSDSFSPTRRPLPVGWQLLMIILTCLCTCKHIHYHMPRFVDVYPFFLSWKSLVECKLSDSSPICRLT